MMVTSGLNEIRNLMSSGTTPAAIAPTHLELGSFAITPAAGDTTLVGSYFRKAWTSNSVSNKTNEYECLIASNEANIAGSINAIGVFNASTGGDMFLENIVVPLGKTGNIEVQFDVKLVYSDL